MRRSSSSGYPLLPLSHSGKMKKGSSVPNWTVALLLISSCICYGLIAYAYGKSSDKGDDEGNLLAESEKRRHEEGFKQSEDIKGENISAKQQMLLKEQQRKQDEAEQRLKREQESRQKALEQEQKQKEELEQQRESLRNADREEQLRLWKEQQRKEQDKKQLSEQELEQQRQQEQLRKAFKGEGVYALSAIDIHGNVRKLDEFKGKVLIISNVASKCGFTDANYKGLQSTYEKYGEYGLEILAFPCNQFGQQEPGSEKEISNFCTETYKVTFPLFSKVEVNGPNTHPLFQFLKNKIYGTEGTGDQIGWNFYKFTVDKKGFPTKVFPQGYDLPRVEQEVYRLLTA